MDYRRTQTEPLSKNFLSPSEHDLIRQSLVLDFDVSVISVIVAIIGHNVIYYYCLSTHFYIRQATMVT